MSLRVERSRGSKRRFWLLCAAVLALSGCPEQPGAPKQPAPPLSPPAADVVVSTVPDVIAVSVDVKSPDGSSPKVEDVKPTPVKTLKEKLRDVRRTLIVDEASLTATGTNLGSAMEVVQKLDRSFIQLNVAGRIPFEPQPKDLEKQLTEFSLRHELTLGDYKAEVQEVAARSVPTVIVGNTKIRYLDSQIRGVVQVEFSLSPIRIDQLEAWLKRMPADMERMVELDQVRTAKGKFLVSARAYWFLPDAFPAHRPQIDSLLGYLRQAGIEGSVRDVEKAAEPKLWKDILGLRKQLDDGRARAEETLTEYARANNYEARWKFFEKRASVIEGLSLTDLFN